MYLNKDDLGAYIYTVAKTGSVYIRFTDASLGSIRLGDHDGIEKYRYKFNVRSDIQWHGWRKEDNIWRYYCNSQHLDKLKEQILKTKEFRKNADKSRWNKTQDNGQTKPVSNLHETTEGMDRQGGPGTGQADRGLDTREKDAVKEPEISGGNTGSGHQDSGSTPTLEGSTFTTRWSQLREVLKRRIGNWLKGS